MADISILAFGADPRAERLSTSAFQQAIDIAQPGDTVIIPTGRFLTGAIFLKSDIRLHVEPGANVLGSQRLEDYPLIDTRVAGIDMRWPAGVINAIGCKNVSITGSGTLDGQGRVWWKRFWGDDEQSGMVGNTAPKAYAGWSTMTASDRVIFLFMKAKTSCLKILPAASLASGMCICAIHGMLPLKVCISAILQVPARTGLI